MKTFRKNEKNGKNGQKAMLQIEDEGDRLKQIAIQKRRVWQQQRKRRAWAGNKV